MKNINDDIKSKVNKLIGDLSDKVDLMTNEDQLFKDKTILNNNLRKQIESQIGNILMRLNNERNEMYWFFLADNTIQLGIYEFDNYCIQITFDLQINKYVLKVFKNKILLGDEFQFDFGKNGFETIKELYKNVKVMLLDPTYIELRNSNRELFINNSNVFIRQNFDNNN